ncbi:uncharacterized protein PV07_05048 [Cladophialophora immunda]|uniref:Uncharacterized protein n=1 Tax=Cladophialophora immunda TaxID=569365 RepID=A0A0D2CDJ7_9EURO|nr:uncharacterized protein PV07_05048 [Cladophialophora immunda]KIW29223.1 hypothetical protein PV07_05048 [Cladophialophora immunda]
MTTFPARLSQTYYAAYHGSISITEPSAPNPSQTASRPLRAHSLQPMTAASDRSHPLSPGPPCRYPAAASRPPCAPAPPPCAARSIQSRPSRRSPPHSPTAAAAAARLLHSRSGPPCPVLRLHMEDDFFAGCQPYDKREVAMKHDLFVRY